MCIIYNNLENYFCQALSLLRQYNLVDNYEQVHRGLCVSQCSNATHCAQCSLVLLKLSFGDKGCSFYSTDKTVHQSKCLC